MALLCYFPFSLSSCCGPFLWPHFMPSDVSTGLRQVNLLGLEQDSNSVGCSRYGFLGTCDWVYVFSPENHELNVNRNTNYHSRLNYHWVLLKDQQSMPVNPGRRLIQLALPCFPVRSVQLPEHKQGWIPGEKPSCILLTGPLEDSKVSGIHLMQ